MTYYLERHLGNGVVDTIPYTAGNSMEAMQTGKRLHAPRAIAIYAQIRQSDGSILATLPGNEDIDQVLNYPRRGKPVQLELWT